MQESSPAIGTRTLTQRQGQVLALIARGYTNGQIADELGITLDGAKFHVGEILDRLNAPSRQAAGEMWRQEHSATSRVRHGMRALVGVGVLGAASAGVALAGVAGALWLVSAQSNSPVAEPTQQEIVAAVSHAGEVFHAKETFTEVGPGGTSSEPHEQWYSADADALRTEVNGGGEQLLGGGANNDDTGPLGQYYRQVPVLPPAADADGTITALEYITPFVSNDRMQFLGDEQHDAQSVLRWDGTHRVADAELEQMYHAANVSYTILLRASDLLPVSVDSTYYSADGEVLMQTTLDYTSVGLVDRSSLSPEFFDPPIPPASASHG